MGVQASPELQLIQWERKRLKIQRTLISRPWQSEGEGAFYRAGIETQTDNPRGKKHTQTTENDLRSKKLKVLRPRRWIREVTPEPYVPAKPKRVPETKLKRVPEAKPKSATGSKPRVRSDIKVQIPLDRIKLPKIVELKELKSAISKAEKEVEDLQQQLEGIDCQREIVQTSIEEFDTTIAEVQDSAGYPTGGPDEEDDDDILVISGGFDEELFNIERSM